MAGNVNTLLTILHHENSYSNWTHNFTSDMTALNVVSSTLSVNGSTLYLSESKFNWSQSITEPNRLILLLLKFHYNISDEGFYIQRLYLDSAYIYIILSDQGYTCIYIYAIDVNLYVISFVTFPFILTTYSMSVIFSGTQHHLFFSMQSVLH